MSVASIGGPADVAGIGQKMDANDPIYDIGRI